jgi:hypothetical protein
MNRSRLRVRYSFCLLHLSFAASEPAPAFAIGRPTSAVLSGRPVVVERRAMGFRIHHPNKALGSCEDS